jgi:hypothetical protein
MTFKVFFLQKASNKKKHHENRVSLIISENYGTYLCTSTKPRQIDHLETKKKKIRISIKAADTVPRTIAVPKAYPQDRIIAIFSLK